MNSSPAQPHTHLYRRALGWLCAALFHVVGVALIALAGAFLVLPFEILEAVASVHLATPQVMDNSAAAILLHVGLSACMWALLVILYKLWQRPQPQHIHSLGQRGSVMTETLIVFPVFLLISMGLGQLAINNVAGILANVAVYEAARTAWLWAPEQDVERVTGTVNEDGVKDRARIAAALVMTPAAPGNFFSNSLAGTDEFKKTRFAMAASQVPAGGAFGSLGELAGDGLSLLEPMATRKNLSLSRALDESTFLKRGVLKFTHAYAVTDIEITQPDGNRVAAELTYQQHQVMPFVRRLFGKFKTSDVGMRLGYYVEFKREYSFRAQNYPPNVELPDNGFGGNTQAGGDGDADAGVGGIDGFDF